MTGSSSISGNGTVPGTPWFAATYESIGVSAPFSGDANHNNQAALRYRRPGESTWRSSLPMTPDRREQIVGSNESLVANPYKNQWRASLVGLSPGTSYEVELTFTDPDGVSGTGVWKGTATTRPEPPPSLGATFYVAPTGSDANPGTSAAPFKTIQRGVDAARAGDTVRVRPGTYRERVTISSSGTPTAYLTLRGEPGAVIDASANPTSCGTGAGNNARCAILITGSYVRVADLEIVGARLGIKAARASASAPDPVGGLLERNHIHSLQFAGNPSAPILIGASSLNQIRHWTVQDNALEAAPGDPAGHQLGFRGTQGGHVIRRNTIRFTHTGTPGVHGSDCIGGLPNQGPVGLGPDSDIAHNTCLGATDDGIELDGSGLNLRVWGNRIAGSNLGFSAAPVSVGPAYVFQNLVHDLQLHWTSGCIGIKTGESIDHSGGVAHFYHNTFYLADPAGRCAGRSSAIASAGGGRDGPAILQNNVFHGFNRSISHNDSVAPTLDGNLHFAEAPAGGLLQYAGTAYPSFATFQSATGQEAHGTWARPQYLDPTTGQLTLTTSPPALVIPGLTPPGASPPVGAF